MKKNMFDTAAIKQFTGLNDEQVNALVKTFFEEIRQSNAEISEQLLAKNWHALRKSIHTMRPGFILFGLTEIHSLMAYLLDMEWSALPDGQLQNSVRRYLELTNTVAKEMEAGFSQ